MSIRWMAEVSSEDAGLRADVFLSLHTPLSRTLIQKLCDQERVLCEGQPLKKNNRVWKGQLIEVHTDEPEPTDAMPQDIALDVVYEDDDLIVVNKARGMVTHPAAGHRDGTLVNALLYHCQGSLSGIGGVERPGIVHRLDKDTSGLIVAAKNDHAHQHLAAQLSRREMRREYEAVVCGTLVSDEGTVDAPIGRDPRNRKRMAVEPRNGKPAVTHYTVLERMKRTTHVACRLETGRTHQIRVHMKSLHRPLLGDRLYGGWDMFAMNGQCLHARRLQFIHPVTGQLMQFETPLPDWFDEVLSKLRAQA